MAIDYAKEASSSIKLVQDMASGSLQLNPSQCLYLSAKLGETGAFLASIGESLKNIPGSDDIRHKALRHLYFAVKRAELLVRSSCCEEESSWLESALTVAQIKEDIVDILLELRWWMSMVGIASARWVSSGQENERELLRRAEEDFQTLFGRLHSSRGKELDEAVAKDKERLLKQLEYLISVVGDTSDPQQKQNYRLAIHVRSRLENSDLNSLGDVELNSYEMVDIIGQGSFGAVMAVNWLGRRCALKALKYNCTNEATTLSAFQHPHIVQFLRFWEARYTARASSATLNGGAFPESQTSTESNALTNIQSFIMMEFLPTDLALHIQSSSTKDLGANHPSSKVPMTQDASIDAMQQVAKAVCHMNEKSVAHRDLKPNNILVRPVLADEDPELASRGYVRVKLGDFGLAKTKAASAYSTQTGKVGTKIYAAPEVYDQETFEGKKFPRQADVWSFGLTFYETLTGTPPFVLPGSKPQDSLVIPNLSTKIRRGLRPDLPNNCPDYLKFCITHCWKFRPEDRPEFADLCRLLRYAQVRSLGIIRHNYDLFTFRSKAGDVRTLPPPSPPRKDLNFNFFWLLISRLPLLFSRRRDSANLQSSSQIFSRQQSKSASSSMAAFKDRPLGRLVNPVATNEFTANSKVDVIFFEGNVGRRKNLSCKDTWVQRGKPDVWWPRDWLSMDFKGNIRVLVLEYRISNIDGVVDELQTFLVSRDQWNRDHTWNRPIVLVGHSLGCVVIEKLVVALSQKAKSIGNLEDESDISRAKVSKAFLASLAGCFFYAPPFTGLVSDASLLKEVFGGLSYSPEIFADLYSYDSEDGSQESKLKEVSEQFMQALSERVKLMALIEAFNTKGRTVVPLVSMHAFVARGGRVEELRDSNHEDTCKPIKKDHASYQHLHKFVEEILKGKQVAEDTSGDKQPVSMVTYLSQ